MTGAKRIVGREPPGRWRSGALSRAARRVTRRGDLAARRHRTGDRGILFPGPAPPFAFRGFQLACFGLRTSAPHCGPPPRPCPPRRICSRPCRTRARPRSCLRRARYPCAFLHQYLASSTASGESAQAKQTVVRPIRRHRGPVRELIGGEALDGGATRRDGERARQRQQCDQFLRHFSVLCVTLTSQCIARRSRAASMKHDLPSVARSLSACGGSACGRGPTPSLAVGSLPHDRVHAPIFQEHMKKIPAAAGVMQAAAAASLGKRRRGRWHPICSAANGDTARFELLPVSTFPGTRKMSIYVP